MSRFISPLLLGSFILIGFDSCADLKEINSFALTSQQVMEKNKNISYGYVDYSTDSSYIYHPIPEHLKDVDCTCIQQKKLDELNKEEYQILSNYFAALALFTDPKSSIDLTPAGDAIQSGTYGSITITDQESSIAGGLTTFLTDVLTTGYKSKKIKQFIELYHDSVAPLISFMKLRTGAFTGKVSIMEEKLRTSADLLLRITDKNETKWSVLFTYELQKKELDEKLALYKDCDYDYDKVIAGGDLIYQNINNLQSEDFKKKLKTIIRNLIYNADTKN
jgi:hypothetical protein